jgi:beta-aspartyl-peptidase (threonine type)
MSQHPPSPRRWLVLAGLLLFLALAAGVGYGFSAWGGLFAQAGTAQRVRAVLDEQVDAWNAGDLDRFLQTYWDSDDLTFYSGGTINRGHAAVAARYRKNYQADGKEMGRLRFSDLEVTPVGPGYAFARARWKLVLSGETVEGLFTLLLRQFPDGWKIVHDHTSRADPPKAKPNPP